jgi:tetratricopeptide (TPR) repeat protein
MNPVIKKRCRLQGEGRSESPLPVERFEAIRPRAIVSALLLVLLSAMAAGCGGIAARSRNARGVRLFDQSRNYEAVRQFEQAIYNDPDDPDGYYNLGAVFHRLGRTNDDASRLAQAEHYYNQCLDRDPNHRHCYRGLAVLLVQQGRTEEAFRLLKSWADRNPASAEPNIELARLFQEVGDRQAAKDHLIAAISVEPENARALAALGRLREEAGQYALAVNNYRQSLWYDRFQPEVAARIAALQPAVRGGSRLPHPGLGAPSTETWVASRNTIRLR